MSFKKKSGIVLIIVVVLLFGSILIFRNQIAGFFLNQAQKNLLTHNSSLRPIVKIYLGVAGIFNRNDPLYDVLTGDLAAWENNYDEAIVHYTVALNKGYSNPEYVMTNRAYAYMQKKDYNKAIADYEVILKTKPSSLVRSRRLLAIAYFETGRYNAAASILKTFVDSVELDSEKVRIYNFLGRASFLAGSYGDAVSAYRKSLDLDPKQEQTAVQLARAFKYAGDIAAALEEVNKVLKTNPSYKPAICALAEIYNKSGEYGKSIEAAGKVLKDKNDFDAIDIACLYNYGLARYHQGDLKTAKSSAGKVLEIIKRLSLTSPEYKILESFSRDLLTKTEGK